jgi:prolyl-tRNA synthetase
MKSIKKSSEGLTAKKEENFSEWYSQIIDKAEIVDIRNGVKGFMVFRPWGAQIIENMIKLYEEELQRNGHKPTFMPTVIPEENLKKESSHVQGFSPEVFWLKEIGGEKLALRPTSETLYTPMFKLWIRSWRDMPMKLYQRGSVFRLDTKSTRPLIRTREIIWIEAHDAFATKKEAEEQVQEDIGMTESVMHKKFGIPFFPMKRPNWDKFAGAEYTIGSDVMMPDGKLIQQPSTHLMGQKFAKAFGATFKTENEKEDYIWQTAYGPAFSRILVSVVSMHGDDKGLVLPFSITPIHVVIIPIYSKENKNSILKEAKKIKEGLESSGLKIELDDSEKRPGEKYHEWELKGVPFRIEIGENEIKEKKITLFTRDTGKKEKLSIKEISNFKKFGEEYDSRILKKADSLMKGKVVECKNKQEIKKALGDKKIARVNFCSTSEDGENCAGVIEKEIGADVRGTLANKNEKASGKCVICGGKAEAVVYVGKSY